MAANDSLPTTDSVSFTIPLSSPDCFTTDHLHDQPETAASVDPASRLEIQPPLRRSTRTRMVSTWLKDFVQPKSVRIQSASSNSSQSISLTVVYPLLHAADFNHLSQDFVMSLLSVMQVPEPHTYSQAKDSPEWIAAMEKNWQPWKLMALGD